MRKKYILLFLFLEIPFFVAAYTKKDIQALEKDLDICSEEIKKMGMSYLEPYIHTFENNDFTQDELAKIYFNLNKLLEIVKTNNCDFNKLVKSKKELEKYYKELKKVLTFTNEVEGFDYVGANKYFVSLKYLLPTFLIGIFVLLFISPKFKNLLTILTVILLFLNGIYFIFGTKIYDFLEFIQKNEKVVLKDEVGSKLGVLKIAALELELPFFKDENALKKGLNFKGNFDGVAILSGHNTKMYLLPLKNVSLGMEIKIEIDKEILAYEVYKLEVLNDDEFTKLDKSYKKMLILYTCYPFLENSYSNKRFIVYARLKEN